MNSREQRTFAYTFEVRVKLDTYKQTKAMEIRVKLVNNGNKYPYFSITAGIWNTRRTDYIECGMMHNYIAKAVPALKPFLKWHLCSTVQPMHYIANTVYHAQNKDYAFARSSAIWPEATEAELDSPELESMLEARLPALMEAFHQDMDKVEEICKRFV